MSLTFFYSYTLNDLCKLHNDVYQHQSKASKSIFRSTVLRLEKLYGNKIEKLDMVFGKDVTNLYNKLNETEYSENTKLQTISTVIKILKMCDAPLTLINSYIKFHKGKSGEVAELKKIEIQSENSIVNDYMDLREQYICSIDYYLEPERTYNEFLRFMILGFFLLQPPTRSFNYINCKLFAKSEIPDDTTHNYCLFSKDTFTFVYNNNRKNSVLPQRLNPVVDLDLQRILLHYIEHYYIDNGNRWFLKNYNGKEISARVIDNSVKEVSELIFEKVITVDDIRASYFRHIFKTDKTLLDNLEIINMLGLTNLPNYLT